MRPRWLDGLPPRFATSDAETRSPAAPQRSARRKPFVLRWYFLPLFAVGWAAFSLLVYGDLPDMKVQAGFFVVFAFGLTVYDELWRRACKREDLEASQRGPQDA